MSSNDTNQNSHNQASEMQGRRRFLGAGTAATPFVLTFVSQPALGVTCFTPSRNLSRNTSLSQEGKNGECTGAESPGNYKAQQTPGSGAYHWPSYPIPSTSFDAIFAQGSIDNKTRFVKSVNGITVSKTFGEALNAANGAGDGNVAFHIIGAYLNKVGGNGAVIPDNVLTTQDIKTIWSEYASKGYFEPMAGIKWYGQQIVDYLVQNGIVKSGP